jgi:hypothetical protein
MPIDKAFLTKLAEISNEWNLAEKYVKTAEQIAGEVVFPSIKELRYAGRRIIDAFEFAQKNEKQKAYDCLVDAHFDCIRARHDAIDTTVSCAAVEIDKIEQMVSSEIIGSVFHKYPEFISLVQEAQFKIANSRFDRSKRELVYKNSDEAEKVKNAVIGVEFDKLVESYRLLHVNSGRIKKAGQSGRRKDLWAIWIAPILLVLFAAIAAWPILKEEFGRTSEIVPNVSSSTATAKPSENKLP